MANTVASGCVEDATHGKQNGSEGQAATAVVLPSLCLLLCEM